MKQPNETSLLMPETSETHSGWFHMPRFSRPAMPACLTALAACLRAPFEGSLFSVDTDEEGTVCCGPLKNHVSTLVSNIPGFLFYLLNMLRIQNNSQVLSQRLFHQIFQVTPDFLTPSAEKQAAFLTGGLPIIGGAALLAILMEARNVYNTNRGKSSSVESYFHALFTASMAFMFLSILYGSATLSFGASVAVFFLSALVAAPLIAGIAYHLVLPDTSNRCILNHFNSYEYATPMTNVTHFERVLNAIGGLMYAMSAVSVLVWEINREIYQRTVAASTNEYVGMAVAALVSTLIGAIATTDYPRVFQAFVMAAKFCKDAGMAAAAFSSVFYYLLDDSTKNPTDYLVCWMLYSAAIGTQSALATKYRFIDNHHANRTIEFGLVGAIEKMVEKVKSCNPCARAKRDGVSIAALTRVGSFSGPEINRSVLASDDNRSELLRTFA